MRERASNLRIAAPLLVSPRPFRVVQRGPAQLVGAGPYLLPEAVANIFGDSHCTLPPGPVSGYSKRGSSSVGSPSRLKRSAWSFTPSSLNVLAPARLTATTPRPSLSSPL